jgi:thiol-disulfide isomerase/thioredoxin
MKKSISRRGLLAAAAVAAGLAGAGLALRQHQMGAPVEGPPDASSGGLWDLKLDLPQGGSWAFASLRGQPLLLNFWATWCPPCVEELPLIDSFYKANVAKSWQVVGIAVDNAKAVKQFLSKTPLSFPTPIAGMAGLELSRSLGNLSGGLPFTVVFDAAGEVVVRHMGKLSAAQLAEFSAIR